MMIKSVKTIKSPLEFVKWSIETQWSTVICLHGEKKTRVTNNVLLMI